jgi:tetratricopeptide (TPR) repeat protein
MTVTPDLEAIQDYFLAKLGKYDKRADRLMTEPKGGKQWYERAYDLYHNDRYEEAGTAFRRAAEEGYSPAKSLYNAACSYALMGDARRATATLEEAINKGWDDYEHIAEDSDFDPIRNDKGFARLVNRAEGDIATRRVTETINRYEDLSRGVSRDVKDSVRDGVKDGINDGIKEGIKESLQEAFGNLNDDWYEVGLDLLRLRQIDKSIDAFQKSIAANEKASSAMYNIACAYSLKGDARTGLEWLEKAVDNGFGGDEKLMNDPDIALLRQQSGFERIRQKAEDLEMRGCCDNESGKNWDENDRAGWRPVVEHHRRVVARYPDNGRAWFNLGYAALQARDFATGQEAFNKTIALNYRVGTSSYNIACGYALQGNRDAAFQWLQRSRDAGFDLGNYLEGDDDLEALHDDPRWDTLRDEVGSNKWHFKYKDKKKRSS